ncbi:MAG: hypothetical protein FJ090_19280 [Deltaproteobacteria bacterium]|nr:hypothetical protein [Deltaproteobacteria bacterium]
MAPNGEGGSVSGGAEREPWWNSLLAAFGEGTSIHALARRFGTNCRRIRRALARRGIRAHGHHIDPAGLGELAAFAQRLGKEPDRVLAKAAGVTPEAVQGERERLGIGAFKPQRRVKLTRDDEAWIRGPVRQRREKVSVEAEPTVVHRAPSAESRPVSLVRRPPGPGAASSPAADVSPSRSPAEAPPSLVRRPASRAAPAVLEVSARTFRGPSAVVVLRNSPEGNATVIGREVDDLPREAWPGPVTLPDAGPGNGRPGSRPAAPPATVRAYVEERERRQRELDELLNAPRRERDSSRARLVRSGETRIIEPEPEPTREVVARRRGSDTPSWRAVDPDAARLLAAEAERAADADFAREAAMEAERQAAAEREAVERQAARMAELARRAEPSAGRGGVAPVPPLAAAAPVSTFLARFRGFSDAVVVEATDVLGAIEAARGAVPACFELTGVERAV